MSKFSLTRVGQWLLLAPAILPLLYIDGLLYPYLTPKTILLRALGLIALALFVYVAASGTQLFWERLKNKITWIPGALLIIAYATSLFGIDFYRSFWSTFERGDGLLTLTVLVLFFYLIILSAQKEFFGTLTKLLFWVGSIVALYALLQWFQDLAGISIPLIAHPQGRVGSTLGNAAFLASYLSLTFIMTFSLMRAATARYRTILYAGAALQLIAIFITATRGSIIALALILLGLLIYWSFTKNSAHIALGTLVVLGILFVLFRGQLVNAPVAPVARIASISLQDPTVSSRLFLWQHIGAEALTSPIVGVGAEHIDILFDRVYDPSAISEEWFDRSHNSYLDYFVQFGVLGLLLYIALIAAVLYVGLALYRSGERSGLYLFLATLVYAIQNFFVFDTAITLWTLLALFAAAIALVPATAASRRIMPAGKIIGGIIALALLLALVPVAILPLQANLALADAYLYHVADVKHSVESLKNGFALSTYGDLEYGYQAYAMYTEHQLTALQGTDLALAYGEAKNILEANHTRYPYDMRTAMYLAHVLDSAPPGSVVDEQAVSTLLNQVLSLSPLRAQAWYIKANIPIHKGDIAKSAAEKKQYYGEAAAILQEYAAKEPKLAEPRYVLASLYLIVGDTVTAKKWADEALPLYKFDTTVAHRAARYYIAAGDWHNAEHFLQDVADGTPGDYNALYDLAKASYLAGDVAKARQIVDKIRAEKPGLVETDPAFMKAMGL